MIRIPFATNSYQSRSQPLSVQRVLNLYPEVQPEDAKSRLALFGTPGLVPFASLGDGPVRALHNLAGVLYAVSGTGLYRIDAAGNGALVGSVTASGATLSTADIGTQMVICGGGAADVWDGTTVAPIADEDFPGAVAFATLDGYGIYVEPDGQSFGITALTDFTSVDALDFASAESAPDKLLTVVVDHREVWLVGEETIEIWVNTGDAKFPFARLDSAIIQRGCGAARSVAALDGSVFWLGDDRMVYRAQQYQPARISQHAIEYQMERYATVSDAIGFGYQQAGHSFYVLTFPSAGATWVYDAASGLWHERSSGLDGGRWRANCAVRAYDRVLVGDSRTGKVFSLSLEAFGEDGSPILRSATSPPIHAGGKRAVCTRFEVEVESGVGLGAGQGADPQLMLQWSDDGGRTWSAEEWRSAGRIGEYRARAVWTRLGMFRERVFRLAMTDPVPLTIISAMAEIQQRTS